MKMAGMTQVLSHSDPAHARESLLRLGKLRQEGYLCDLTILVEGQKFKAHKAVMAACSDYFFAAICGGKSSPQVSISRGTDGEHMTIELQYVRLRGFAPLLDYAYSSDLKVNAADVIDVLTAASYMQMFNVASACSEFIRSNLLWNPTQPNLANIPPLVSGGRPLLATGQQRMDNNCITNSRNGVLPAEAVHNLLRGQRANALSQQPPMLIPISSMSPYDVGLQRWVDTVAGTQNFLSQFVNGRSSASAAHSPASSLSPPASPPTQNGWGASCDVISDNKTDKRADDASPNGLKMAPFTSNSAHASPLPKETESRDENAEVSSAPEETTETRNSNNNNNSNNSNSNNNSYNGADKPSHVTSSSSSSRKSVAVKVEPSEDDEEETNGVVGQEVTSGGKTSSPAPGDAEDSWQSLQRLYSFQSKAEEKIRSRDAGRKPLHGSSVSPGVVNRLTSTANSLQSVLEKIASESLPRIDGGAVSMVPRLNGMSMQSALLQQQQRHHQHQPLSALPQSAPGSADQEKLVADLPAVPPSGQYMSVRRRTLQSNVPKPHQCQICGSRFTRFHNLKQHIKLHSGIKPYECDECGKRFTRNYTLRLHKMKHVGMRNFKCGTCSASFTSLGEFRAHLRISMHSHLPSGSDSSPHSQVRMLEPEDLSGSHMSPSLLKFDPTMLRYGVGSPGSSGGGAAEGSTGTISPPSNNLLPYMGSHSPHFSDRSLSGSPQDLSTKRSSSDMEGKLSPTSASSTPRKIHEDDEVKRQKMMEEDEEVDEEVGDYRSHRLQEAEEDIDLDDDEPMALVVDTSSTNEQVVSPVNS